MSTKTIVAFSIGCLGGACGSFVASPMIDRFHHTGDWFWIALAAASVLVFAVAAYLAGDRIVGQVQ